MKTFILLLALLITTLCIGQSTDNYYWYFNQKIPVETAPYDLLLIGTDQKPLEGVQRWASTNQAILSVTTTPYKALRIQLQQDINKRATLIEDLQKNFSQLVISQSINYQGSTIGVLNQVVLKPKGKDAQEVIQQFGSAIKLLSASKYNTYLFEVLPTNNTITLANRIQESGLVEFSQPNFIGGIRLANPLYPNQYYLNNTGQFGGTPGIDINAPEAWNITQGCNNVRVAVIDEGVADHEDMAGRVANGFDPLFPGNPGRPITANDNHGTACAGIIGAGNNTVGIRGVAGNAIIVPVKIFNNGAAYANNNIADAINWAWDNGDADVLSNSWGGPNPDANITNAINNALTLGRGGLGCIVVAAAGNNWPARNFIDSPASINNVIAVGAIEKNGNIYGYSQQGNGIDLVAPSGNINGTGDITTTDRPGADGYDAGNYTNTFGGTSAACPQVAGVAALMLSVNPNLTEAQVRTALQQSATDMGASGYDLTFGFGRVDAEAAVRAVAGGPIAGPSLVCANGTFSLTGTPPGPVSWSSSNTGILTINSNGNATQVGSASGSVVITATIGTVCGNATLTRTVWVGVPDLATKINGVVISNAYPVMANYSYQLEASPNNPGTTFSFSDNGGSGDMTISLYSFGNPTLENMYVSSNSTYGDRVVKVTASNTCGNRDQYITFYLSGMYRAYPNPARSELTLAFANTQVKEALPSEISLFAEESTVPVMTISVEDYYNKKLFKDGDKIILDVSNLARGTYYLHSKNSQRQDNTVDRRRIILE